MADRTDIQYRTVIQGRTLIHFAPNGSDSFQVPAGVFFIGPRAFDGCKLRRIELPWGLREIGDYAFANCKKLEEIRVPRSVYFMGKGIFKGCEELSHAEFPPLEQLPDEMFEDCHKLAGLVVPEGVRRLGKNMFHECWNLNIGGYTYFPLSLEDFNDCFGGSDIDDMNAVAPPGSYAYKELTTHVGVRTYTPQETGAK